MDLKKKLIQKGKDLIGDDLSYSEIQMIEMCVDIIEGLQVTEKILNDEIRDLTIRNKNLIVENKEMMIELRAKNL